MGYKIFSLIVEIKMPSCWCVLESEGFFQNSLENQIRAGYIVGRKGETWRSSYSYRKEDMDKIVEIMKESIFFQKGIINVYVDEQDYPDFFNNIDGNGGMWMGDRNELEHKMPAGLFYYLALSHGEHMENEGRIEHPPVTMEKLKQRISIDNRDQKIINLANKVVDQYHRCISNCNNNNYNVLNINGLGGFMEINQYSIH